MKIASSATLIATIALCAGCAATARAPDENLASLAPDGKARTGTRFEKGAPMDRMLRRTGGQTYRYDDRTSVITSNPPGNR